MSGWEKRSEREVGHCSKILPVSLLPLPLALPRSRFPLLTLGKHSLNMLPRILEEWLKKKKIIDKREGGGKTTECYEKKRKRGYTLIVA